MRPQQAGYYQVIRNTRVVSITGFRFSSLERHILTAVRSLPMRHVEDHGS